MTVLIWRLASKRWKQDLFLYSTEAYSNIVAMLL